MPRPGRGQPGLADRLATGRPAVRRPAAGCRPAGHRAAGLSAGLALAGRALAGRALAGRALAGRASAIAAVTMAAALARRLVVTAGRGGRPVSLVDGCEQRVLRVPGRLVSPVGYLGRALDLSQEQRGAEPARACLRPPVPGAAQPERSARRRTYISLRSSARSRCAHDSVNCWTASGSRPRRTGRSVASPRNGNGSSLGLSVHRVETRGRAGNTWDRSPIDRPGTKTAGHCRPLAAWTVSSLTESDSPTRPVSRAELLLLRRDQVGRNAPSVGSLPSPANVAATSVNASRSALAATGSAPGLAATSMSRPRTRSASAARSSSGRPT